MATTNLQPRVDPGKAIRGRDVMGNGTPVGDTALAVDTAYPIGSSYLDLDTGVLYFKTAAATWTNSSEAVEAT